MVVTVKVPERGPSAAGTSATLTVQVAPAANVDPHVELDTVKSPDVPVAEIAREVVPAFFTVTGRGALVVPRS